MRTKNLLWGALACLAFAACSDDDVVVNPGGAKAEGENAYVAVRLVMSGNETRAWDENNLDESFTEGENYEVNVQNATFFLFDASGKQVQAPVTKSGEDCNFSDPTQSGQTIQKESDVLILLEDKAMPSQIVAVLNMPEGVEYKGALTLTALCDNLGDWSSTYTVSEGVKTGSFVMSNSVYVDENNKVLRATPVPAESIGHGETAKDAQENATTVIIPVERVLAQVNVGYSNNTDGLTYSDNEFVLSTYDSENGLQEGSEATEIIPCITGWWLHSNALKSTLVKSLSPSYTWNKYGTGTDENGNKNTSSETLDKNGWWNNDANLRSYWTNGVTEGQNWGTYSYSQKSMNPKYCYENISDSHATTLMVAALLTVKNDQEKYERIDLVQWLSYNFKTLDDFKRYTANRLSGEGYKVKGSEDEEYRDLSADDLVEYYNTAAEGSTELLDYDWQAAFMLADGLTMQKNGTDVDDATEELKDNSVVGIFKHYKNGQTYYFTKIQHNPAYKETEFAIVRNHKYQVNLSGISGLGTPVSNPDDDDPEDPEDPEDPTPDPGTDPDPDPTPDPEDPDPEDPDPDQPLDPETPDEDHSALKAQVVILKYRVVTQDDVILNNK